MENNVQIESKNAFINDFLDHKSFSEKFYDLIKSDLLESENSSLNIALTAPWDSGKTYFLKNFQTRFKNNKNNMIHRGLMMNVITFLSTLLENLSLQQYEKM